MGIEEGDAIGVLALLRADLADDADVSFLVALRPAKDKVLFGGELMAGKNARAVKAEKDGGSGLGKDFAVQVAPDEEDGDLLGDASRGAHNLWWQERGQREGRGGTIWYQEEEVRRKKGHDASCPYKGTVAARKAGAGCYF